MTNGQVMLELMLGGSYTAVVGQASSLTDTNWHHLAGTYDGTNLQVYLDGASVGSQPASGPVDVVGDPLRLGLLAGQLTDVRLYNLALPPGAVAGLINTDSVGDGIPDWWRKRYFGSTTTTNSSSCATCDPDGDGFSNWEEYLAGTDPTDPNSKPNVHPIATLTIPNAWAAYTSSNSVQVTADIRSTNQYVAVKAAEFFVDRPRATGTGIAMNLNNNGRDSTNVTATGVFTPTFPAGERHEIFVHAQGKDLQWCQYKKIVVNPNINDILDKIQTNYSAFADLQFNVTFTETINGTTAWTRSAMYSMKGPYKVRTEYDNGDVTIRNENRFWSYNNSTGIGDVVMTPGINGDFSVPNSRQSDFFWDVPLCKTRLNATTANSVNSATFDMFMTALPGQNWPTESFSCDYTKGMVSKGECQGGGVLLRSEYLNPVEVLSGHWLFSQHRHTMQFDSGDQIVLDSAISNIQANQGLDDSLFDIPSQ